MQINVQGWRDQDNAHHPVHNLRSFAWVFKMHLTRVKTRPFFMSWALRWHCMSCLSGWSARS